MSGMQNINDLCFLQVNGVSKLEKEINETKDILCKVIDKDALHRNEITQEIEGIELKQSTRRPQTKQETLVKNKRNSDVDTLRSASSFKSLSASKNTFSSRQPSFKESKTASNKPIDYKRLKVDEMISKHLELTQLY